MLPLIAMFCPAVKTCPLVGLFNVITGRVLSFSVVEVFEQPHTADNISMPAIADLMK